MVNTKAILCILSTLIYVILASHPCWTVNLISNEVFRLADINPTDGTVTMDEFKNELLVDWGFANGCLSKHDFTSNWDSTFHDTPNNAHTLFNNLDTNGDGNLCELEIVLQLLPYDTVVADGQKQLQEMINFFTVKHPDPHYHYHGCH